MITVSDAKLIMEAYRDHKDNDIAFSLAVMDLIGNTALPAPEEDKPKGNGLKTGEPTKSGAPRKKPGPPAGSNITVDTEKILSMHNSGMNNNQIAKQLGISPNTVATHVAAAEILTAD